MDDSYFRQSPLDWRVPFLDLLGARAVDLADGRGRLALAVDGRHLREIGILHGGVVASLLDSVMGMVAASVAPAGQIVVTAQLNVNFIRPAWEGENLVASGEVQHAGRQTAVMRGEIRTEAGTLVGSGTGTFLFLVPPSTFGPRIERQPDANSPPAPSQETGR